MVRVTEAVLRRQISKQLPRPDCPPRSTDQREFGPAVADVHVGAAGRVMFVESLEAPDESIAEAMTTAVKQWEFKPLQIERQTVTFVGKLTLYFVNTSSGCQVMDPKDTPYIGRW